MTDRTALIRPLPESFDRALVGERQPRIDIELARFQHDEHRRHLSESGYTIEVVSSDEAHPDCVFIEDTAVILGEEAVVSRHGAISRRGETLPVAASLASRFALTQITEPGTLDGGDVLIMGDVVCVGRSARTNSDGIDPLRAIAFPQRLGLVTVEVREILHLEIQAADGGLTCMSILF